MRSGLAWTVAHDLRRVMARVLRRQRLKARGFRLARPALARPVPRTLAAAKLALRDKPLCASRGFRLAEYAFARFDKVDPRFLPFVRRFLAALRAENIPLRIYRVWCDEEELAFDAHVFAAHIPELSPYRNGRALRLIHHSRGFDLTPLEWEVINGIATDAARAAELVVEWGGTQHPFDPSHWELKTDG